MNFYPRFPGDYSRDTQDLSLAEHGALTLLLDAQYGTAKALPVELAGLNRICRADTKAEKAAVARIVERFFTRDADGYWNKRARSEIERAKPRIEHARENGRKGGRPTTKPDGKPAGLPAGIPSDSDQDASGNTHHIHNHMFFPNGKNKARPRFDARASLVSEDNVPDDLADEWLAFRKQRRAPVTATVLEVLRREARKAGWTVIDVLRESLVRGWTGFKAEWVEAKPRRMNPADVAHMTTPGPQGEDPALKKIKEDEAKASKPSPEELAKWDAIRAGVPTRHKGPQRAERAPGDTEGAPRPENAPSGCEYRREDGCL
jgi:uncharacterized protein YdaU (DUF1376 family)